MIYDDRLIANRQPFPVVQLVQQGRARRKRTGKKKSKKRVKTGAMAREHIFLKKDLFRNPVLSSRYRNDRRGAKHRKLLPSLFFAAWKWLKKSASADETHIPGRVLSTWTSHFCSHWSYPLGIHANSYPHRGTRGWGGGGRDRTRGDWWNPSPEFLMLQYFETTLPSMESLWSSQQDEVHFKGVGTAGALWCHQQWSPTWPPSWILQIIKN